MADARRYGLTPQLDIRQILSEAPLRWLRPAEICEILRNHRQFRIETEPPNHPPSGSLFLFDRKVLRYFRKDGHNWRKKKDGKTVKEAHERLKSGSIDVLHCYYAHGEENSNFQRRSYWMLEEHLMHIVLVHYREVKDKKETYCRTRDTEELGQGSYVDSPVGSCSITNYPQMTSPVTDIDSQNNTQISEFEDTESDKSHASSRHNPFPEVPNFNGQSLINPQVGIYIQPQSIHSDQHIKRKVTQVDIARLLGETSTGFTTFNGSGTQLDLSSWETDPASWSSGNRNPDFLASSTLSFDFDHQSNGLPADGVSDSVHVTLEDNLWQDALKSDSALPVNEVSPMFASLLKQLSLDLPNTDGNKGIQKNDSFSRWASKELDEVVDGLSPNSGIHWDEVRNATMSEGSCLSPDDHQTYAMSPSLSKDQLFSISDIYPSWSYAGAEIMVFVSGSFLVSTDDILKHKWSCMFGQEEVPAEVVADGVLRCLSPACRSVQVPFYITCSNRFACSEVREFEFHPYNEKDLEIYDPYTLATNEMVIYTHLDRILSTGSPLHQDTMHDFSSEKINMCNKVSSLMMGTNDELCLVLKKASDNDMGFAENPNDQLMQSLLKQKLHLWLINKVLEGGKGPCTLDQHGFGVIHLAAALGYNWVIAPLIAAGLNINFRDARGWTALHWAASYGRESTIVALLSLGANSGALTDPTPIYPSGRMAAELASDNGHKGIAGFLAESSLTTHLSSLNLKESRGNETTSIPNLPASVFAEDSGSIHVEGDLQAHLSLKDSLSAVRNAAQAAARIYQVYRVHSFHRKKMDEYKEDKVGISDERALSRISAKPNRASQNDEPAYAAAVKIQKKFRGWKKRKAFLIIRQHVVKIQAHVRGYQVRKHFRKIVWSVGIVEKAILRWRRKGSGLRGFRSSGLPEGTSMQALPVKEDDYDFLREGRKQTEQRLERALAKVKSMVQYPEARDQYRRLLTGVEEFQGSKVILERFLYDDEEIVDTNMMFVDIDELLEDETVM